MKEEITDVTLFIIDPTQVKEVDGVSIIPKPIGLLNVQLNNRFLINALEAQRNCEMQGEPFVIRLLPEDPLDPPVFAVNIVSIPAYFSAFTTGGIN